MAMAYLVPVMPSNPPGAGKAVVSFSYDEKRAAYLTARGEELDQSRGYIVSAIVDWWFEHRVHEPLRKEVPGKFPKWTHEWVPPVKVESQNGHK